MTQRMAVTVLAFLALQSQLPAAPDAATQANAILQKAAFTGGLIAHVNCGDGALTAALRATDATVVHGLATQPADLTEARKHARVAGVYGPVTVELWQGPKLPYGDRMVNLLLVGEGTSVSPEEAMRVLTPGGTAVSLTADGTLKPNPITKPWPAALGNWPHFLNGPDNNAVAHDQTVGPPGRLQWQAGPVWGREHDVTPDVFAPVSLNGRLFYIQNDSTVGVIDKRIPDRYSVMARDAFNGTVLWKHPISDWYSSRVIWGHIPVHSMRRLVADGNRVYVTLGLQAPVTALDATTGKVVQQYAGTEKTAEIVCCNGRMALVTRDAAPLDGLLAHRDGVRFRRGYEGPKEGGMELLLLKQDTGDALWRKPYRCMPLTLAMAGNRVLFSEADAVVCVDAATGTETWRSPFPLARTLVISGNTVFVATAERKAKYGQHKAVTLAAFDLEDGKELWKRSGDALPNFLFFFAPLDVFVTRGLVWGLAEDLEWNKKPGSGHLLGVDIRTGETRQRIPMAGTFTTEHHVRCYKGKATDNFLLFNKRGIEFIDLEPDAKPVPNSYQWVRGVCRYGILPCNGLIYAPPHSCACYPGAKLDGFSALAAAPPAWTVPEVTADASRVTKGPAFDRKTPGTADPATDWPTYRGDAKRTGHTPTSIPSTLTVAWKTDIGGKLSSPVVANGKVLAAAVDTCTLHAWNAETGSEVWSIPVGGRIDSPPTVHANSAIFGCRDGSVYCVDLTDGKLVWRFQAEPCARRVGAFGRIESAWPVHGSVLVRDGVAYLAAGRSSFLDGGIYVYGVDAATGAPRFQVRLAGPDPQDETSKVTSGRMGGALPDIMSCDDQGPFLRQIHLDWKLTPPRPGQYTWGLRAPTHLLPGSGFLDDTMFNRTVWKFGPRVDRSQLLVRNGTDVFGVRVYEGISWNCPVHNIGDGNLVFRQDVSKPVPKAPQVPKEKRRLNAVRLERYTWHTRIPYRVRAMLLAGKPADRLFVAGVPDDVAQGKDPLAFIEGRSGGKLLVLDATTGKEQSSIDLDAPPVWDGLAAANGKLYMTTTAGKIVCLK